MTERPILFSAAMVRALLAGTKTQTRRLVKPQFAADSEPVEMGATNDSGHQVSGHSGVWWDDGTGNSDLAIKCPYGQPGDRLWVRETYFAFGRWETRFSAKKGRDEWHFVDLTCDAGKAYGYATDGDGLWPMPGRRKLAGATPSWWKRPAIFMPRATSRITLEITEVRVQRLQEISEADARAEGLVELVPRSNRSEGLTPAALCLAAAATVDAMPRSSRRGFLAGALAATLGFAASPSRPWEVVPQRWTRAPSAQQVYAVLWESINGPGSWDANPVVWALSFKVLTP